MKISPKSHLIAWAITLPLMLAGCVSQSKYDQALMENQQLRQQVAEQKDHIARLQGTIAYTVNSDQLFKSGSWEMTTDGKEIISNVVKRLAANQQNNLVVNGYTDNMPVGPQLRRQGITTNQELSQKRAQTVMEYMISQGVNPDMITARGHGDANPVASNDSPQGRAMNRRVEVAVVN